MPEDDRHRTSGQASRDARAQAGRLPTVLSPLTTRPSPTRASVYRCLLSAPDAWWTVRDIAAAIDDPHITTSAIRETVYVLLHDQVLEQVPAQSPLTIHLTPQGDALLRTLTRTWDLDEP